MILTSISRHWRKAILTIVLFSAVSFLFSNLYAFAAINQQINYQGKLTNNANVAVADGTYEMEFKLYTAASGGSPIWTETRTGGNEVQVTSGLFSVMLGSVTSLSGVNFNQTLYLGVNIESDGEMTPRKILGTVPAAFEALNLGGASSTQYVRTDQAGTISASSTQNILSIIQTGSGNALGVTGNGTFTGTLSASNLSGTNTGDVTLAGENYLSIAGQVITALAVNLSGTNVTGTLAAGRFPALTGDITTSAGSLATTLATVNSNVGSFGSSTAIPSFTVNAKGLITAASTNAVIAPAGTLTGTTLASNVVTSSLTSVGTIATGVWQGTAVGAAYGGTGQTSYAVGDLLYASGATTLSKRTIGSTGDVLWVSGGVPAWTATSSLGFLSSSITSSLSNGFIPRWNGSALINSIIQENGTVVGINATSSSYTFNLQGSAGVNPFNVASSTGTSLFTILNNGNVGISTGAPTGILHVVMPDDYTKAPFFQNTVDNSAQTAAIYIGQSLSPGRSGTVFFHDNSNTTSGFMGIMNYGDSEPTGLFVKKGGNVGIGTTSPSSLLNIYTTASPASMFTLEADSGNRKMIFTPSVSPSFAGRLGMSTEHPLALITNNLDRVTISSGGNVGIGTTGPISRLSVLGENTGAWNTGGLSVLQSDYATNGGVVSIYKTTGLNQNGVIQVGDNSNYQILALNPLGGNVGIGTTGPGYKLDVNGDVNVAAGSAYKYNAFNILYASTTLANLFVGASGNLTMSGLRNIAMGAQAFDSSTTGSENVAIGVGALTANTTGFENIAIGTSALGSVTEGYRNTTMGFNSGYGITTGHNNTLIGNAAIAASYNQVTTGSNNISIGNNVAVASPTADNQLNIGNLIYGTGLDGTGSTISNGNVGIGTTGPNGKLQIKNSTTGLTTIGGARGLILDSSGNINELSEIGIGSLAGLDAANSPALIGYKTTDAGNYTFGDLYFATRSVNTNTAASVRMTIQSTGNVGIGTTTPDQLLVVAGTIRATNLLGGATTLSTDVSGNIIRTPSDANLKEDIQNINSSEALNKVLALQGVTYFWKDKGRFGNDQEIGFIAQQVEGIVPQVVKSGGDYKSLNYGNLTALLAGAIQEQQKQITENASSAASALASVELRVGTLESLMASVGGGASNTIIVGGVWSAMESFGTEIVEGLTYIKNFLVQHLTTQNLTIKGKDVTKTGFTIYDRATGLPICVFFENGIQKTSEGECPDSTATSTGGTIITVDSNNNTIIVPDTTPAPTSSSTPSDSPPNPPVDEPPSDDQPPPADDPTPPSDSTSSTPPSSSTSPNSPISSTPNPNSLSEN